MVVLIAAATLIGVAILWLILGYVVVRGLQALNWAFFTQRPLPYGQPGGGVGPALLGSVLLMAAASLVGVPIGVGAGIYLSEFGRGRFAGLIRLCADLVAGLPGGVMARSLPIRLVSPRKMAIVPRVMMKGTTFR